jgi:hypothetical protein
MHFFFYPLPADCYPLKHTGARVGSDSGGLAGLAESFELFSATALAGLLVIGLAPHFFPKAAALAQLAEASNGFLDRLAGTDP